MHSQTNYQEFSDSSNHQVIPTSDMGLLTVRGHFWDYFELVGCYEYLCHDSENNGKDSL